MKNEIFPIDAFRTQILESIIANPVTIIVADTGAGKSTRVPQFLLEATDHHVVVTQPRRLAARSVAARVAQLRGCELGEEVGFRTAVDHNESSATRCLFVTDGLQQVRELTRQRQSLSGGVVLILDEVHEWNSNIETLVAWVKTQVVGTDVRVVLMSATVDSDKLSAYYNAAPVINVPGRMYRVFGSPTDAAGLVQKSAYQLVEQVIEKANRGLNTLVFLPGKGEIEKVLNELRSKKVDAEVLPLHGDLNPSEQDRIFRSYGRPKIVLSTNIAQTSVTIPDIHAVVDSGLQRQNDVKNGVQGLYLVNISQADSKQRAGRAGRVQEGEYVLCNDTSYSQFNEYPVPEILRTLLDQTVLRLAGAGIDAETLEFFHQPDKAEIHRAKQLLRDLEAIDSNGRVTKRGHDMNRFPTSVRAARMLLEGVERNCLDRMLTIAAIMGSGSSLKRVRRDGGDKPDPQNWKNWYDWFDMKREFVSDYECELELFETGRLWGSKNLAEIGIFGKTFQQAMETRMLLVKAISSMGINIGQCSHDKSVEAIQRCIVSGMVDKVFRQYSGITYIDSSRITREADRMSIFQRSNTAMPAWVVGNEFDLQAKNRRGYNITINLLNGLTAINPMWIADCSPHLVSVRLSDIRWDRETGAVVQDRYTVIDGQDVATEMVTPDPDAARATLLSNLCDSYQSRNFPEWIVIHQANEAVLKAYKELLVRSAGELTELSSSAIRDHYAQALVAYPYTAIQQITGDRELISRMTMSLEELVDTAIQQRILSQNPDTIKIAGADCAVVYSADYYGKEFYAKATVTAEVLQLIGSQGVTLPSGRTVTLVCGQYSANTPVELVAKLEEARIESAWHAAKSAIEKNYWRGTLAELPENLLSTVEVTRTTTNELVQGWVSLEYSSGYFYIKLVVTENDAREKTMTALRALWRTQVESLLQVPREMPWYEWGLTELGRALESEMKDLLNLPSDFMPSELTERFETIPASIDHLKSRLSASYIALQEMVSDFATLMGTVTDLSRVPDEQYELRQIQSNLASAVRSGNMDESVRLYKEGEELVKKTQTLSEQRNEEWEATMIRVNKVLETLRQIRNEEDKYYDIPSRDDKEEAYTCIDNIEYYLRREDARVIEWMERGQRLIADLNKYIAGLDAKVEAEKVAQQQQTPPSNGSLDLSGLQGWMK